MLSIINLLLLSNATLCFCKPSYLRRDYSESNESSASNAVSNYSAKTWPAYKPTNAPMFELSSDEEFSFFLGAQLALSNNLGANTGEILRAATQVVPGDFESVYSAFNFLGEHVHAIAKSVNVTQDPVGSREAYLRAATYYRAAAYYLIKDWSDSRGYKLWNETLYAFNNAMALMKPVPGERFTVKAHSPSIGDFETIGVFYKAKSGNAKTPTVIVGTGYDGTQEELYHEIGREILARGLNFVSYEGPGQPTVIREQHVGFISDWWDVVTPIVDHISDRPDVDMSKLALVGISFGGQLAPIAASRESRFSALLSLPGTANLAKTLDLPPEVLELYKSGNKTAFDEVILSVANNATADTSSRYYILQSLWTFQTHSPYDWWTRVLALAWTPEMIKNISMPAFVSKGQDDTLIGAQANTAYNMLVHNRPNGQKLTTFFEFPTNLGAGEHCAIGAESYQAQVALDWLAGTWGITYANGME